MKMALLVLFLQLFLLGMPTLSKGYILCLRSGADCTPILAKGACYNPNTYKDHCNFAANSYFQRKSQANGLCEFIGSATPTSIPTQASGCVYKSASTPGSTSSPPFITDSQGPSSHASHLLFTLALQTAAATSLQIQESVQCVVSKCSTPRYINKAMYKLLEGRSKTPPRRIFNSTCVYFAPLLLFLGAINNYH